MIMKAGLFTVSAILLAASSLAQSIVEVPRGRLPKPTQHWFTPFENTRLRQPGSCALKGTSNGASVYFVISDSAKNTKLYRMNIYSGDIDWEVVLIDGAFREYDHCEIGRFNSDPLSVWGPESQREFAVASFARNVADPRECGLMIGVSGIARIPFVMELATCQNNQVGGTGAPCITTGAVEANGAPQLDGTTVYGTGYIRKSDFTPASVSVLAAFEISQNSVVTQLWSNSENEDLPNYDSGLTHFGDKLYASTTSQILSDPTVDRRQTRAFGVTDGLQVDRSNDRPSNHAPIGNAVTNKIYTTRDDQVNILDANNLLTETILYVSGSNFNRRKPVVDRLGEKMYFVDNLGGALGVSAIDLTNGGSYIWRSPVGRVEADMILSPEFDNVALYVSITDLSFTPDRHGIYRINTATGEIEWFHETPTAVFRMALVGTDLVFAQESETAFGFDGVVAVSTALTTLEPTMSPTISPAPTPEGGVGTLPPANTRAPVTPAPTLAPTVTAAPTVTSAPSANPTSSMAPTVTAAPTDESSMESPASSARSLKVLMSLCIGVSLSLVAWY